MLCVPCLHPALLLVVQEKIKKNFSTLADKSTFRFAPSSFAQLCWIEIKEDDRYASNVCPLIYPRRGQGRSPRRGEGDPLGEGFVSQAKKRRKYEQSVHINKCLHRADKKTRS